MKKIFAQKSSIKIFAFILWVLILFLGISLLLTPTKKPEKEAEGTDFSINVRVVLASSNTDAKIGADAARNGCAFNVCWKDEKGKTKDYGSGVSYHSLYDGTGSDSGNSQIDNLVNFSYNYGNWISLKRFLTITPKLINDTDFAYCGMSMGYWIYSQNSQSTNDRYLSAGSLYDNYDTARSSATNSMSGTVSVVFRKKYHLYYYGNGDNVTLSGVAGLSILAGVGPKIETTASRVGYNFLGWSTNSGASLADYAYDKWLPDDMIDKNISLYAVWEPKSYTLTLNHDNGTSSTNKTVKFRSSLSATPPTRTGYDFLGYYDANGNQYISSSGQGVRNYDIAGNLTLYAHWQVKTSAVTLERNGGSNGSTSITATFGSPMPAISLPSRYGYVFDGYNDSSGTQYYNKDGGSARNWNKETAKVTLYAQWKAKSFKIKFDGNGGKVNGGSSYTKEKIDFGESVDLTLSRDGYKFLYFTNSSGTKYYLNGTSFKVEEEFSSQNADGVILYAQWEIEKYDITFKGNGGTVNNTSSYTIYNCEYGSKITINKNVAGTGSNSSLYLYRKGYKFSSFDKVSITGNTITIPDFGSSGADVDITASWEVRKYTIIFDPNGKTFKNNIASKVDVPYTNSITMPNAECTGFLFAGWYARNTSGELYKYNQSVSMARITQNNESSENPIYLYAQWEDTWANDENWGEDLIPPQIGNDFFEISKPAHLGWIAQQLQSGNTLAGVSFKQQGNIDLGDLPWLSEGKFEGEYNGNGYYIFNIYTTSNINVVPSDNEGLFATTNYAVLQNIHILSGNFVGENNVGSIVGYAEDTIIRNCVNHADVSGSDYVGGIVGVKNEADFSSASATISGCVNYGQVTGAANINYIGGIVGEIINSTIDACYVRANVSGWSGAVGGIAGFTNDSTIISSCAFIGDCSGNGIDGDNGSYVACCLVDSTYLGNLYLDGENCVVYYYGELQTDEPSDDDPNWTKINDKWFPSGLAWLN